MVGKNVLHWRDLFSHVYVKPSTACTLRPWQRPPTSSTKTLLTKRLSWQQKQTIKGTPEVAVQFMGKWGGWGVYRIFLIERWSVYFINVKIVYNYKEAINKLISLKVWLCGAIKTLMCLFEHPDQPYTATLAQPVPFWSYVCLKNGRLGD